MEQPTTTGNSVDLFQKVHSMAAQRAAKIEAIGFYPYYTAIEENHGSRVIIDGRELIMIGSNNYLGLSWDPRVIEAAIEATRRYGTSCSGSRFLNGTLRLHEELETALAEFAGKPAALSFTTGYQTNLGAIQALSGRHDHVFSDRLNHGSLVDGMLLAAGTTGGTRIHRYQHHDLAELERLLNTVDDGGGKLIVTDGVFSMEGDIAPLPEIGALARRYGARVYLDEAHALGVIGATGRGSQEHFDCYDAADVVMCTFSKSFGAVGGFIAGEPDVVDHIKHNARSFIFSASMPPATIAAVSTALRIMKEEPHHTRRLQAIGQRMIAEFKRLGFNVGEAQTPIIPLIIGDDLLMFRFYRALMEHGVYANPVVAPAVPPGRALIRTSYMAIHSDDELDRALEVCARQGRALGII
ncbi:MAG: aminotransferase class I/II-fold pyridoxal phosphate-dependent enzyme [Spirochaetaceae bacterium]|nr:aminotransferase class I/II-fold pyridoxal phosphate-dependent enzyme [Spirochaetaceae bacterium]